MKPKIPVPFYEYETIWFDTPFYRDDGTYDPAKGEDLKAQDKVKKSKD